MESRSCDCMLSIFGRIRITHNAYVLRDYGILALGSIQTKDARFARRILSVPEHSHLQEEKTLDAVSHGSLLCKSIYFFRLRISHCVQNFVRHRAPFKYRVLIYPQQKERDGFSTVGLNCHLGRPERSLTRIMQLVSSSYII